MYVSACRVTSPRGQTGINAFLHLHGSVFVWPDDPSRLPETNPGVELWNNGPAVPVGGNRVHSYLDILAADDTPADEIEQALTGLWLHLVADDLGSSAPHGQLPNPLVFRRDRVLLRFGVEPAAWPDRASEMADLRRAVDSATAHRLALGDVR